ncbi:related to DNA-directed RNA polymerase, mitochondrial [Cephalotrichum gorgonifer]|uniref:DNA-directed RNA polymerase n=1 Tax=Cephalotrichum gorgonifer TaxID=2041049 RepID=A0AAE8STE0_9PEZI|nr:related to DNA-directed RNA polymerase, mitochondrial [Cephalotrichum gorgonifer]
MLLRQNPRHALHRIRSLRYPASTTRLSSTAHYTLGPSRTALSSRQDSQSRNASRHPTRSLATAVDGTSLFNHGSFNGMPSSMPPLSGFDGTPNLPYHELRHFDVSQPLQLKEPAPTIQRLRMNREGISGDVEELVAVFNACLQVQKLERAKLVLKRLGQFDEYPRDHLVLLHNTFLRASLEEMRLTPDKTGSEELHKWYELHIRRPGLPQTAETVACMLKASILSQQGARLSRSVSRYMGMAPGEAGLEVLSMADILSDQDLAVITDICPTYNFVTEDMDAATPEGQQLETEGEHRVSELTDLQMPQIQATPQKGLGLKSVQQTLSLFDELPQGCDVSTLDKNQRREIQSRLERDCVDAAVERWREEHESLQKMGLNSVIGHESLGSRMYEWQYSLEERVIEELKKIEVAETKTEKKREEDFDRCLYGPFLRQSTPSRLAAVTILATLNAVSIMGVEKGAKLSATINGIAKLVEEDIREQGSRKIKKSFFGQQRNRRKVRAALLATDTTQNAVETAAASSGLKVVPTPKIAELPFDKPWPTTIRAKVGAALLSALIDTAKIKIVRRHPETKEIMSQYQRAFNHTKKLSKGKKIGMLFVHDELVALLKKEPKGNFLAKHLPMVVEPEPWSKFSKGAFLETSSHLVRLKLGEKDQRMYTEAAMARGDLDQVLKGLDVLGKTAWRINNPVLSVMLEAWNNGDEIASIPALSPEIPLPPEPTDKEDRAARNAWRRASIAAENKKSGFHSVRCFTNLQLEVARAYRNQTFYFPHNIDFRGRAYPLPTYLNHMGADHVRGLLRFAEGKELGEQGLRWLKIHLANVFGFSKASLNEREAFAEENMPNVLDSVANPLGGRRWWLEGEDPWQCLAACFELKAAMDLPDPTKYVSALPVHQDGTCNGLQHYAALGGDTWGAQQVNLEPGDRPADVYTAVANLVIDLIEKDCRQNNPFAHAVRGKITRKVVKQTVMTNVYGVTFAGAKKQVCRQIDAAYPNIEADTGYPVIVLSSYIAHHIFNAMSTMFRGAHEIQTWLGEVGGRVCNALMPDQLERIEANEDVRKEPKSRIVLKKTAKTKLDELSDQFKNTIVWTTPLRMPVAQPYRKSVTRVIPTCIQDLSLTIPDLADPVNRRKQLQAFPPNFIHSLDASHMMLSALQCHDEGLSFAAVHDSFWTHAADVDVMNTVLRDSFVRIHSEDVIGRLGAEFEARYKGSVYLAKIKQRTPVGKKLIEWRKLGRRSMRDELLLEVRRQKLLNSDNLEEVAEGGRMVTAGSIFEEFASADALAPLEGAEEVGLGKVTDTEVESALADGAEQNGLSEEEADDEPSSEWLDRALQGTRKPHFQASSGEAPKKREVAPRTIQVWLPLTFPPVPEKGDFDVSKLKSSQYFFS